MSRQNVSKNISTLGSLLAEYRTRVGLSQKEVADLLGYATAQVVSDWERGVRSPPGVALRKLIKIYRLPVALLYEVLLEERTSILEKKLKKMLRS